MAHSIKGLVQYGIKLIFDFLALPFLLLSVLLARIFSKPPVNDKPSILIGMSPNNNYIYLRDELHLRGYMVSVIPWIIPKNEENYITYDVNLKALFPRTYNSFIGQLLLIYGFFIWSIFRYDLFILPFRNRLLDRTSFLSFLEFQLLRIGRKKIFLNPYGGDIQYPEVWLQSPTPEKKILYHAWQNDPYYSNISSKKTIRNTLYCARYADKIMLAIDWPDYIPGDDSKKLEFAHLRIAPILPKTAPQNNKVLKIFHCSNHDHFKGTQFLIEAVNKLNKDGEKIILQILRGQSHQEILNAIAEADIIFDQILLGAYGRFALEAMASAKPVICYLRPDFINSYHSWKDCPIINTDLSHLQETLEHMIQMKEEDRILLGQKSFEYVRKYHSADYVTNKLIYLINDSYGYDEHQSCLNQ